MVPVAAVAETEVNSSGDFKRGLLTIGVVRVLLVRVCVPVKVANDDGKVLVALDRFLLVTVAVLSGVNATMTVSSKC